MKKQYMRSLGRGASTNLVVDWYRRKVKEYPWLRVGRHENIHRIVICWRGFGWRGFVGRPNATGCSAPAGGQYADQPCGAGRGGSGAGTKNLRGKLRILSWNHSPRRRYRSGPGAVSAGAG